MNTTDRTDRGAGETAVPTGTSTSALTAPGPDDSRAKILELIDAHKKDCARRGLRSATMKDLEYGYSSLRAMGGFGQDPFLALKRKWTEAGMSDSQMNRRISNMKLITRWGANWSNGYLKTDPLSQLEKIATGKKAKLRTFTLDDARKILKAVEDSAWHLPFLIYFSTGVRKMALMLRIGSDFNPETHLLTVRVGEGNKVDHEDLIPTGRRAAESLGIVCEACPTPLDPLFPSLMGGFYSEREPHRALTRACAAAGVVHGGCHAMRRCAATQIARMDDTGMASLILGHKDSKKTLAETLYIDAKPTDAVAAVEALEDALLE